MIAAWLVTAAELPGPVMVEAPFTAVNVKSAGVVVAPELPLSTTLTRVRCGTLAVLVIVQVAFWPSISVTEFVVAESAPVHCQTDGVYPPGPDSRSR